MIALALSVALAAFPVCPEAEAAALEEAPGQTLCALAARDQADPAVDRAKLEEIFARERYARARRSDSGAWAALLDRLRAWLAGLFESGEAQSFSQVTRFVVLTLAGLLAAVGALRLAGRWSLSRRPRPAGAGAAPQPLALDPPAQHLARARAALARAPREAIREGLLALLSALEVAHLARPDRVRTNRELVGELPGRGAPPALVERVAPLMRWYDGAFYSLDPVPQDGAARFVDGVERLSRELEARPA